MAANRISLLALVAGCNGMMSATSQAPRPDLAALAPPEDAPPPAAQTALLQGLAAADEQRVADTVTHLGSMTTRNTCSDPSPQGGAIGAARDWIRDRFAAIPGLHVTLD